MSASTTNRKFAGSGSGLERGNVGLTKAGPLKATKKVFTGCLAGSVLTDTAVNPLVLDYVGDGTMRCLGFVTLGADNTAGADGALPIRVQAQTGILEDANAGGGSAITSADMFKPAYGVDNQTCSKLSADGPCIGMITGVDSATGKPVVLADPFIASMITSDVSSFLTGASVAVGRSGGVIGFFGVTPAAKGSAYTQTYSTANKTVAAPTYAALTGSNSGTANGALEAEGVLSTAGGNTYSDAAVNAILAKIENNIAELAAQVVALAADDLDNRQTCGAIIDDLQSVGLVG